MQVTLPWPPKGLSPNARGHWRATSKLKKAYREACAWQAILQGAKRIKADRLAAHFVFYPPDRRHRDQDNMIASIKELIDGLADVLGVDDSRWSMSFEVSDQIGGMVKVQICAAGSGSETKPSE